MVQQIVSDSVERELVGVCVHPYLCVRIWVGICCVRTLVSGYMLCAYTCEWVYIVRIYAQVIIHCLCTHVSEYMLCMHTCELVYMHERVCVHVCICDYACGVYLCVRDLFSFISQNRL